MLAILTMFNDDALELDFAACRLGDHYEELVRDAIANLEALLLPGGPGHAP